MIFLGPTSTSITRFSRASPLQAAMLTCMHTESADDQNNVCQIRHRYKYQSWPSEEHAAFAFARLAKPGHTTIGPDEFVSTLKTMQLDYNLGDKELRRVFDAMDTNGDGRMSLDEFRMGRSEHPFTRTLVETLSGASSLYSPSSVLNDCNFDISKSTAEFYQAPLKDGFHGEHVEIRKILDYNYHDNYTKERQLFQDALIRSNLLVGKGSEDPWYVLTCGPMVSCQV